MLNLILTAALVFVLGLSLDACAEVLMGRRW
jgi:hypothetical protein